MIFDVTQINNELDLLEIRLEILDPYVDFFVIGESTQTFSGHEKPLYFKENRERFNKWDHKIIHHISPVVETNDVFERTAIQKDSIRDKLSNCDSEDVIFYGDVDELWKPITVDDKIYKLEQWNYSYYFNNRSSEIWQGTNACKYKNLVNLNELRANHDNVIGNAGWHLSNMGGIDQITKKLNDYDHQEFNNGLIRGSLESRIRNGEDYVGRQFDWQGKPFVFWEDSSDLPDYLLVNREKYAKYFK